MVVDKDTKNRNLKKKDFYHNAVVVKLEGEIAKASNKVKYETNMHLCVNMN